MTAGADPARAATRATGPAAARDGAATTPGPAPRPHAPAPQPPHAALIYDGAADLLITDGWCQGRAADLTGRCIENALYLTGLRHGVGETGLDDLVAALDLRLGMPARIWNDAPGREQGEVVALLRTCAREARRP